MKLAFYITSNRMEVVKNVDIRYTFSRQKFIRVHDEIKKEMILMDEKKELGYYDGLIRSGLSVEELEEEIKRLDEESKQLDDWPPMQRWFFIRWKVSFIN